MYSFLHATNADEVYALANAPGSPFRERITWFLLFLQATTKLETEDISLWSALTASETQTYLDDEISKEMTWKLWKHCMKALVGLH